MPRLVIEWTSAGDVELNESLADQIAERAVELLARLNPIVHGELGFDPYAKAS
jgi:hypothetical protein